MLIVCFIETAYTDNFQQVQFSSDTIYISPLRIKRAKELGKDIIVPAAPEFEGTLVFPDKSPPYATIILLHGCTVESEWRAQWQQRLVSWGYAVLIFDAFFPRQIKGTCSNPYAVHPGQRALDIKGAVRFLSQNADIDSNRIGVMGLTHGAWSVLYSLTNKNNNAWLKAAVAVYPLCGEFSQFSAPVWVLTGEQRHGSDSYPCDKFLPEVPSDYEITLRTYFGSKHPMEMFAIDDASSNNLTHSNEGTDSQLIDDIHEFLLRHLY